MTDLYMAPLCFDEPYIVRSRSHRRKRRKTGMGKPVIDAAALAFAVMPTEITGKGRHQRFVRPRAAVCGILNKYCGYSTALIGKQLYRDHTSIMHLLNNRLPNMLTDPAFKEAYDETLKRSGLIE